LSFTTTAKSKIENMAKIVFVHGIDQQLKNAQALEEEWLNALSVGVNLAGYPELADVLTGAASGLKFDARMVFYGDLFLSSGQQGNDSVFWTPEQYAFAEEFAKRWLEEIAAKATDPIMQKSAKVQLASLDETLAGTQGVRSTARSAIAALACVKGLTNIGIAFAERYVTRSVAQVSAYFTDERIRACIQSKVSAAIDADTKIIIAHSLGSVVAFEVVHHLNAGQELPLLITLGSPLGLRNIIYERLKPQPPFYPPNLHRWLNIADKNDFVAAEPCLSKLFSVQLPPHAEFENKLVDNGPRAHDAECYLRNAEVGSAVGALLAT
jgi:hypothetical protein